MNLKWRKKDSAGMLRRLLSKVWPQSTDVFIIVINNKEKGKYDKGEKVGVWKTFYKNVY